MKNRKRYVVLLAFLLLSVGVYVWLRPKTDITVSQQLVPATQTKAEAAKNIRAEVEREVAAKAVVSTLKVLAQATMFNIDFYGQVKDQYNKPVADAVVNYAGGRGLVVSGSGNGSVVSDTQGRFHIAANGGSLKIYNIKCEGCEIVHHVDGSAETYPWSFYSRKDVSTHEPNDLMLEDYSEEKPYIFKAWKAEKYAKVLKSDIRMPFFELNQVYTLDLLHDENPKTIKYKGETDGDIRVVVTANEKQWKFQLTAVDGGLLETTDEYMNSAPETGYQEFLEYSGTKEDSRGNNLYKKFYFKSHNGKAYGAMRIRLYPYTSDKESAFEMTYAINLEGGRELAVKLQE